MLTYKYLKMKFKQGIYIPKNPEKYIHSYTKMNEHTEYPIYRSSWELSFFKFCDYSPSITKWSSEPVGIKYFNPVKKRQSTYYPDAIIIRNNTTFLIEIKPKSQLPGSNSKSSYDKLSAAVNEAKYNAAKSYCEANNMQFIILSDSFFKS